MVSLSDGFVLFEEEQTETDRIVLSLISWFGVFASLSSLRAHSKDVWSALVSCFPFSSCFFVTYILVSAPGTVVRTIRLSYALSNKMVIILSSSLFISAAFRKLIEGMLVHRGYVVKHMGSSGDGPP